MGFGALLFGHSPQWLVAALEERLAHGVLVGPQAQAAAETADYSHD